MKEYEIKTKLQDKEFHVQAFSSLEEERSFDFYGNVIFCDERTNKLILYFSFGETP